MDTAAEQCERAEYRCASMIASELAPQEAELEATGLFSLLNQATVVATNEPQTGLADRLLVPRVVGGH
jgi:hypothetical protein